jgi:hypothetical protein
MRRRRRPFVAFFSTLLVWLTAIGSTRTVVSRDVRLLGPAGDAVPSISVALPRATAIVTREATRLPTFAQDLPSFLPPKSVYSIDVPVEARHAQVTRSRVRLSQGLASTYDATAPPTRS